MSGKCNLVFWFLYITREETGMLLRCRRVITCNIYADELRPLTNILWVPIHTAMKRAFASNDVLHLCIQVHKIMWTFTVHKFEFRK